MGMKSQNDVRCKVCNSKRMYKFLSLGPTPLANKFIKKEYLNDEETYYPLDVYFCEECLFVQIGYIVDPNILFKDYIYVSSTSETLKRQFKDLAEDVKGKLSKSNKNPFIVEIASNDGTLLKNFEGYNVLGVEPASNIARIAEDNGIPTLNNFFDIKAADEIKQKYGKADVIIGTNIFAHIPNLNKFVEAVKILLDGNGFAVFESPYLVDLMENTEFDTIYHEHIYYLSIKPLLSLFKKQGMELFDAVRTHMHGGSIRIYVKNKNGRHKREKSIDELMLLENKIGLDKRQTYDNFAFRVLQLKIKLVELLYKLKTSGYSIAGYGAPAKGNTLLNYLGVGGDVISYIVDNNSLKQGLYTPGKRIPILPIDALLKETPDYLLILAWNFADEVMLQQKPYKEKGGKFIIPIPEPRIA